MGGMKKCLCDGREAKKGLCDGREAKKGSCDEGYEKMFM